MFHLRMGFLAFALDVKMSMPRVATTMLALVSLTNLRNSVIATLPTSGNISWLEELWPAVGHLQITGFFNS